MARTLRDTALDSRAARDRLPARGKPYYRKIEEGLHLGYRKPRGRRGKPAGAGKWVLRHYVGKQSYAVTTIGAADDLSDADGVAILNFKQAQDAARAHMVRLAHDAAGVASGPLTVKAALDLHLEHLAGLGQNTDNQKHHASAFILPAFADTEVAKLKAAQLRRWHHGLAKLPPRVRTKAGKAQQYRTIDAGDAEAVRRRQSSANRILTTLKAALNHAFTEELVASDKEWRRAKPFKDVESARVKYLQVAEAKRFLNACDPAFRPLAQAALQTGCRYGELTRLKVGDFNADSGTLAIWQSKSGKARHVILTDEGVAFFTELTAGRAAGELMLRRANGGAWKKSHQNEFMAAACVRARITPSINFHALRHTWASLAIMGGMPLMVVARNLGHVDTRQVERHYGHMAQSYVVKAVRAHAPKFGFKPSNVRQLADAGR
jgi:integrase